MRLAELFARRAGAVSPALVRAGSRRAAATLALLAAVALGLRGEPSAFAQGAPRPVTPAAKSSTNASASRAAPSATALASAARAAVDDFDKAIAALGGLAGACVVDVESGRVLGAAREHRAVNPASNAKIVTAYAALRTLGPAHRFATGLFGAISGGEVAELTLRGQGDPSLSTADVIGLARALARRGVKRVGAIFVDQAHFDDRVLPPAFEQQPNETAAFRATVAAVSVDANAVTVSVAPTAEGDEAVVTVEPPGVARVEGRVRTGKRAKSEALAVALAPAKPGSALPYVVTVSGRIPEGAPPAAIARRLEDPRLVAGHVLKWALAQQGVASGPVATGAGSSKREIATHKSAPLSELLRALGKDSQNFSAEMIFKATGAASKGGPASAETGAAASLEALTWAGAKPGGLVVKNGSGLFDANRVSPAALTSVLRAAVREPSIAPEFVAHLAIGGVDGTLRGRFKTWAGARVVRAKTGTLAAVAALSGYVFAPAGASPLAFSFLATEVPGKVGAARRAIDAAVDALATELHAAPRAKR